MTTEPVIYTRDGKLGVISINNPPVNALGVAVRSGLMTALQAGLADKEAQVLVLVGTGASFVAGGDIREFNKPPLPPLLSDVIDAFEASAKPVIAALNGTAFGGGLEIAMGCSARIALRSAKFALPEVKLGLIPGGGGTQRLPRLAGIPAALDIITSGRTLGADEALKLGIVDAVVDSDLMGAVRAEAQKIQKQKPVPVGKRADKVKAGAFPAGIFDDTRAQLQKRSKGQLAPQRAVDAIENASRLLFEDGQVEERRIFQELRTTPESKAARHLFFAEREAGRAPTGVKSSALEPVASAGVVGAGTMGRGIAISLLSAGIPVKLLEMNADLLKSGLEAVEANYQAQVDKGRITQAESNQCISLLQGTTEYADLKNADLIIEAAFEEMPVKGQIFQKLDAVCKPGAILATNTSTLDVDEIANFTKRPEAVIGLHFFSPANIMRLLEIVKGAKTADDVLARSLTLARRIGKIPAVVGVCDGFVGNRMLYQYKRQSEFLLEEGVLPHQVDAAMTKFGMAMGVFATNDLSGNDISWAVRKRRSLTRDPKDRYSTIADQICELGRFGQKTKKGWYRYESGNRTPLPDAEVEGIIVAESERLGIKRRNIDESEIVERCLFALVNEGARILEEGIATRSGDIDIIYVNGYGFPAWRGGPMFYAEQVGLKNVLRSIHSFAAQDPGSWKPSKLLERLVQEGHETFDALIESR